MSSSDRAREENKARLLHDFSESLTEIYSPGPYAAMRFVGDVLEHLEWISEQMESERMPAAERIAVSRIVHGLKEFRETVSILEDAELDRMSQEEQS